MKMIRRILGTMCLLMAAIVPSRAQDAAPTLSSPKKQTIAAIASQMSRQTGIAVLSDSTLASRSISMPAGELTAENLEQHLTAIIRVVRGAVWTKVYLPEKEYKGDDVADFAYAQAKLFGKPLGTNLSGDTLEIFGRKITLPDADYFTKSLTLKPYYLLTLPVARNKSGEKEYGSLSPEEQQQYAQQKAAQLANADDKTRQQWLAEHTAIFMQLLRGLSPEQRQTMFAGMGGVMRIRTDQGDDVQIGAPPPLPADPPQR